TAEIAGHRPNQQPDWAHRDGDEAYNIERDPRAIDDAAENIAAIFIRTEEIGAGWRQAGTTQVLEIGVVRGEPRREYGADYQQRDDGETDHGQPITEESQRAYA